MVDDRGLSTLSTEELDIVTTAATTTSIIVLVGGVPKKITLENLIAVIGGEISFLDLSDTPGAYDDGDTLQSSAVGIDFVTV